MLKNLLLKNDALYSKYLLPIKRAIEWKLYLLWHSWIIRVLYMEMTYCEPQTPLFLPPHVNFVNKNALWKIGESEHDTDCDVTVGITNSYAPNICIYQPMFCASRAKPSEVLQVLWRKWQIMEIIMLQAVQGMWSAEMGWCLYSERHGKQITRFNKITHATKGTWLAPC